MTPPVTRMAPTAASTSTRSKNAAGLSLLGAGALVLASAFALAGCQTVHGLGEDIQYASDKTAEAFSGESHNSEEHSNR